VLHSENGGKKLIEKLIGYTFYIGYTYLADCNECTMYNIREPSYNGSLGEFADCPYRVYSDQMALGTVSQKAGPREKQPTALKTKLAQGDHQA
jgi:hypothetical protein